MSALDVLERPVELTVHGATHAGMKRSENQDYFLVAELSGDPAAPVRQSPNGGAGGSFRLGEEGALLLVADGMGGAAAGALASRLASEWVHQELAAAWAPERNRSPERFASLLRSAAERANRRLHEHSLGSPECRGMGSTLTAAGVLDGFLYIAQVGDSRAYLVRGGVATQLTRDQSLVQQLVDSGSMTEEEAERSVHKNVILQAMGVEPSVQAELTYQALRRGDLLLLCSDGLTGTMRGDEIARIAGMAPDLESLCAALIRLANERGAPDNVTAVAMRVDGLGVLDPTAEDTVGRQVYNPTL